MGSRFVGQRSTHDTAESAPRQRGRSRVYAANEGSTPDWLVPNFEAMVRIISVLHPNLVVNTGDISFDGAGLEDDLAFARACHAELDVPFRAVPGNHDVGDNPWQRDDSQRITEPRLVQYRRYFGDDHWFVEAGRWMAIGYVPWLIADISWICSGPIFG